MNEFVNALDRAGYFAGLPADQAAKLKSHLVEEGWAGIFHDDSFRFFHADAEDLAEGGVGEFIRKLESFLTRQGVTALEIEDEVNDKNYSVHVNGVSHLIYDEAEYDRDSNGEQPGLIWGLAMARGFRIVDGLLERSGSSERLYAVNGGNDLVGMFLTPEMHRIILAQPGVELPQAPYAPTEEYEWFGAPHD
jgi:hypothetical protein